MLRPVLRGIGGGGSGGASGIPGVDPDAVGWAQRVQAAGGTYTSATLAAVSNFCVSAKASGYWGKLNRVNLFCGDSLTAALVPLKVGGGSATETNVNFVAGDYTEATGLTGNGTTKYLRTGLIPSVSLVLNDTHLSLYNRGVAAGQGCMGAYSGGGSTNALSIFAPLNNGNFYSDQYNAADGRVLSAVTTPYGHMVGTRTASNAHTVYEAGAALNTNATTGGGLPTVECFVFATNGGAGTPHAGTTSTGPFAGYSIGSGLSAGDVTAFNTHMETFQDALGRGVV